MNLFSKLKSGMSKTSGQIGDMVDVEEPVNDEFFEDLEDALVAADVGIELTEDILKRLRNDVDELDVTKRSEALAILKQDMIKMLKVRAVPDEFPPKPYVILVVGVNGVGKTTTIGKITKHLMEDEKKSVTLGAVDTFRAGAIEQLKVWADRTGADFVAQYEGADPAAVAYDAYTAAQKRGSDVLILDTAGRLHNKSNLMKELDKIVRVLKKTNSYVPNDVYLVLDATTGQNALRQTEVFNSIIKLTGLVITKLDGTAKGGIALALTNKFNVPIKKIGVGEGIDDLQDFDPASFVEAMFGDLGKKES